MVLKARQTSSPESPLTLHDRPTEGPIDKPEQPQAADKPPVDSEEMVTTTPTEGINGEGHDSDENFIKGLLLGAKLLCKDLHQPEEGWRYVYLAGDVMAQSKDVFIDSDIKAKIEECKGIIRMAMAISGQCRLVYISLLQPR